MAETCLCPGCGLPLPDGPDGGVCPRCQTAAPAAAPTGPPAAAQAPTGPYRPGALPALAELGRLFPQLEILGLLGRGGMGAVYQARQVKLDRLVALKLLPPQDEPDPTFAERFGREARTLARLSHPGIVAVHDFGEAGGLFYFLMEFVPGGSLRPLLRAGPVPPAQALAVAAQVCDALQYAHEEGVVHRDIKPENILLDPRGRVKIADFGLAKLVGQTVAGFTLTGTHQVMGTPHYMAPEQWERPHAVDHRADVYALGVVLYELLTGELPLGRFAAPSEKAAVDPRLEAVVLQALEKDPARRPPDVRSVRAVVEQVAAGATPHVAARRPSPVHDTAPLAAPLAVTDSEVEHVRQQVRAPAAGLLVAGVAALVSSAFFVVFCLAAFLGDARPNENLAITAMFVLLSLPLGGTIVIGARRMRGLRAYELATVASLLAMLPLTVGWPIGLPLGLWAFLVLRRPEVRAAFAAEARRPPGPPQPSWVWPLITSATTWVVVLCGLGALVGTIPIPWAWLPHTLTRRGVSWPTPRTFDLYGLQTWPSALATAVFAAVALASLVGPRMVWPRVGRRTRGLLTVVRVLLAVVGLAVVCLVGVWLGSVAGRVPAGEAAGGVLAATLAAPLIALPWLRRTPGRALAWCYGGWLILALVAYFVVQLQTRRIEGHLFRGSLNSLAAAGGYQLHWAEGDPTFGPGPVFAGLLALGLIAFGAWRGWSARITKVPAAEGTGP